MDSLKPLTQSTSVCKITSLALVFGRENKGTAGDIFIRPSVDSLTLRARVINGQILIMVPKIGFDLTNVQVICRVSLLDRTHPFGGASEFHRVPNEVATRLQDL